MAHVGSDSVLPDRLLVKYKFLEIYRVRISRSEYTIVTLDEVRGNGLTASGTTRIVVGL